MSGGMYTFGGASEAAPLWCMLLLPGTPPLLVVLVAGVADREPRAAGAEDGGMAGAAAAAVVASDADGLMGAPPRGDGEVEVLWWDADRLTQHRVSESPSLTAAELQKYSE